jgi:hypothetical protein
MNGVYLRALAPDEFADRLVTYLREQGYDWDEERVRSVAPIVQEKISTLGAFPSYAGFFFHDVQPADLDGDAEVVAAAREQSRAWDIDRAAVLAEVEHVLDDLRRALRERAPATP